MSKLSNHQIASMIQRIEIGRGADDPTAMKYRAELASRLGCTPAEAVHRLLGTAAETVQVGRSRIDNTVSFQQNEYEKPSKLDGFREDRMEHKKDTLAIAGDQVEADQQAVVEVGKWVGRQQAFGMIANKCSAAQAEILKRMKDSAAHKAFGLTREEFCDQHLGISRQTVDRIIANYEEFGAAYFAMTSLMRISPSTYRLLGAAVTETNEVVFGDERIPITKANSDRIIEAVNALRKDAEQKQTALNTAKSDLKKARDERDNAKKAAEKARQDLADFKRRADEMFPNADHDHKVLLQVQSDVDFALQRVAGVARNENLSPENQGRLIGLVEHLFRQLVQVGHEIRELYGVGWNAANPAELLEAEEQHAGARNLISEYVESNKGRN
ncbi:MAG TPA: hypothetical protein VFE62_07970 [Gemmataceae bacterium]|nr:hypothetical protein [Gemmataceae bacterium]